MLYPWQQSLWQFVLQQYQENRLPHALLFLGPVGLGKLEFAQHLAKMLLCEQSQLQACEQCRGCQLFNAGSHPDFYSVTTEAKSKSIKIDQIRELTFSLSQTAARRGWQVVILHPAEAMNRASANALLKTLEEPSGKILLILLVDQLGTLPATLLSRCQRLKFSVPEMAMACHWLQTQTPLSSAEAQCLIQMSEGAPKRALQLVNSGYLQLRQQVIQSLSQLNQGQRLAIDVASEFLKLDLEMVLRIILSLAMDVLRLSLGLTEGSLENTDYQAPLRLFANKINVSYLANWLPELIFARTRLQRAAGINPQLLIEAILLQWQNLRAKLC